MATEEQARDIKRRHSLELLRKPGVVGVGVEKDADGSFFIAIHLETGDPTTVSSLPAELEGCPVRIHVSGPFLKLS